jgi:hypothetical protein
VVETENAEKRESKKREWWKERPVRREAGAKERMLKERVVMLR